MIHPGLARPPLLYLGLPIVLHHGQVLGQVLEADLELWVLCAGELKELCDQQVGLVPQLGCLAGVGGQQGAEVAQVLLRVVHRLFHALHLDVSAHNTRHTDVLVTLLYFHLEDAFVQGDIQHI